MNLPGESQTNWREGYSSDTLEAYHVFRGARTLFFWLILIFLILVQCCFWIVDQGYVDASLEEMAQKTPSIFVTYSVPGDSTLGETRDGSGQFLQHVPVFPDQPAPQTPPNSPPEKPAKKAELSRPLHAFIKFALPFSNSILSFASVLYCLSLLVGIQLAIVGQMGGYTPAGKAFFISLVLAVVIIPWQALVTPNMVRTLYSYEYLIRHYVAHQRNENLILDTLYYGRFTGFWLLSILLLLAAQLRSHQAVRMIRQKMSSSGMPASSSGNIPLSGS